MDSVTALHYAVKKAKHNVVKAVSFDYGSKHNDQEYFYAKAQCDLLGIESVRVDLKEIGKHLKSDLLKSGGEIPDGHYADPSMKRTVVPFRNGIMLSIAAGIAESCGAEAIILGNHFGDHAIYPDCRVAFVTPMGAAIEEGTYARIKLITPFAIITKTDIARLGAELGINYQMTYSCYKGAPEHCGTCGTCVERKEAFRDSKIPDPTIYLA